MLPAGPSLATWRRILKVLAPLTALACASPVAAPDSEHAEPLRKKLAQAGIAAELTAVSETDMLLWVPWSDAERAARIIGAGRVASPAAGSSRALIPSREEQREYLRTQQARELETTLGALQGIQQVRVQFAPPSQATSTQEAATDLAAPPRAWVIARAGAPRPADSTLQEMVAAVAGCTSAQVRVLWETPEAVAAVPAMVRLGPLSVPPSARGPLRLLLAALIATNLLSLAGLTLLWRRTRLSGPQPAQGAPES